MKTKENRMKLVIVCVGMSMAGPSFAADCGSLIGEAESASGSNPAKAKALAQQAVTVCRAANVKSARPYMVLATIANAEHDFDATVSWSKQALTQEPGLGLAYMDMGAGYMGMKRYDDAIAAFKDGLKSPSEWSAKLNFNLGLAMFKREVDAARYAKAAEAEPYFVECTKLDPSIGNAFFYIGTIEQQVKNDLARARTAFGQGCQAKDAASCKALASAASAPAPSSSTTGMTEPQLWTALEQKYLAQGIPKNSVDVMMGNLKKGFAAMAPEQRVTQLKAMIGP
jgi:tetratricopeptide (TPR) repeat protein